MIGNSVIYSLYLQKVMQRSCFKFSSVQSLSHVRLFATPWIAARQASLSITISRSSLRLMSIESGMPSSHLILCRPLLLLPPIPPSIRVFSNESTLRMRCTIFSVHVYRQSSSCVLIWFPSYIYHLTIQIKIAPFYFLFSKVNWNMF